jgi:plasmid maintenance system antidote protein VapI
MTTLNMSDTQNDDKFFTTDDQLIKRKINLDLKETDLEEALMRVALLEEQLLTKVNVMQAKVYSNEELEDKVSHLTDQNIKLAEQRDNEHDKFVNLQKSVDLSMSQHVESETKKLNQILDVAHQDVNKLKSQLENTENVVHKLKKLNDQLTETNVSLSQSKNTDTSIVKLEARIAELEAEIHNRDDRLANYNQDREMSEMRNKIIQLMQQNKLLNSHMSAAMTMKTKKH